MPVPFETEFSQEGKTKIVPYDDRYPKFRVELFKEVWKKGEGSRFRCYYILIQLDDNTIVLCGYSLWDVLHRAGKHLALLTKPKGER